MILPMDAHIVERLLADGAIHSVLKEANSGPVEGIPKQKIRVTISGPLGNEEFNVPLALDGSLSDETKRLHRR